MDNPIVIGILVLVVVVVGIFFVLGKAQKIFTAPTRITVVETPDAKWKDVAGRDATREKIKAWGFVEIGTFVVPEMPGIVLNSFVSPDRGYMGVIYEHPMIGQWVDFVIQYADGGTLTVTSAKTGHELEHRPNHDKIYSAQAPVEELYTKLTAQPPRAVEKLPTDAKAFSELFQKAYAEETDWRNAKGGPSTEEIRRVAETAGIKVNDEMLEMQRELTERQAYEGLVVALKENLRAKKALPDDEWATIENKLVFIHDKMSKNMVMEIVGGEPITDAIVEQAYANLTPRETFRSWNAKREKRFEKYAEIEQPLQTDVYRAPS